MPKEEWGTKRLCPETGKRFYDLGKVPPVSPYTGEVVEINTGPKSRSLIADKADPKSSVKPETASEEDEVLVEDEEDSDLDLGDDVLEEDDEENVSLDDLADVPAEDDEN